MFLAQQWDSLNLWEFLITQIANTLSDGGQMSDEAVVNYVFKSWRRLNAPSQKHCSSLNLSSLSVFFFFCCLVPRLFCSILTSASTTNPTTMQLLSLFAQQPHMSRFQSLIRLTYIKGRINKTSCVLPVQGWKQVHNNTNNNHLIFCYSSRPNIGASSWQYRYLSDCFIWPLPHTYAQLLAVWKTSGLFVLLDTSRPWTVW